MAKAKKAEPRILEAENKMYEAMLVLKPDILESNLNKKLKEFKKYLEDHDCKVTEEDIWEKRAFPRHIGFSRRWRDQMWGTQSRAAPH